MKGLPPAQTLSFATWQKPLFPKGIPILPVVNVTARPPRDKAVGGGEKEEKGKAP